MSAQIIQLPTAARFPPITQRLSFGAWLRERVGGRWCVRKVRTKTWQGLDMSDRVQLLEREYLAYEREYEAIYGPIYG